MKNSNNTIGDRTRDLLACSAVPQATAPRRAPHLHYIGAVILAQQEEKKLMTSDFAQHSDSCALRVHGHSI